jgi:hypothetical protein
MDFLLKQPLSSKKEVASAESCEYFLYNHARNIHIDVYAFCWYYRYCSRQKSIVAILMVVIVLWKTMIQLSLHGKKIIKRWIQQRGEEQLCTLVE